MTNPRTLLAAFMTSRQKRGTCCLGIGFGCYAKPHIVAWLAALELPLG